MNGAVHTGLTSIGGLFDWMIRGMNSIVDLVTKDGNEIMLIPVGIFVAGAAIGLGKRLIGR